MYRTLFVACGVSLCALGTAIAQEVPDAIKERGALNLAVSSTYPPMEYVDPDTGELTGFDIDLGEAIADKLGLEINWSKSTFPQLIPSLTTGRTDFILSGLSDRESRRETMDFVDYLRTGAQYLVAADGSAQEITDICGKKVGSTRSTSYPAAIEAWSKENCEANGKPAVVFVPAENAVDARDQLRQGRTDAIVQGTETLPYVIKTDPGRYRILGEPFTLGYAGIAFRKEDTQFRDAVAAALDEVIADGTYAEILAKYGLDANGVDKAMLNASPE